MEQIDTLQRTVRQPFQHVQRIAHVDADVGQPSVADMPKRRHDAVQKGFAADETMAGMRLCLRGHMLTAAKADLELHRTRAAEQVLSSQSAFLRHRHLWKKLFHQRRLDRKSTRLNSSPQCAPRMPSSA